MLRAIWNGTVIAEDNKFETVKGNAYFPPTALKMTHIRPSDQTSTCSWKGVSNHYDVVVGSDVNEGVAWYYPEPRKAAAHIVGYVAFRRDVEVSR